MGTTTTMTSSETLTSERLVAGRYRLRTPLGRGGMGVVWAAEDELLQRPVAVKEIHFPPSVTDEERELLRERTMREARAAARLDHPCAVRVFDVCEDDGHPFIVMELIVGRTLSDLVHTDGPIAPAQAAEIGLCLLDALEAAHAAGIVHRDVKPGNVIVRDDGRVSLTDFGIASTAGDPSITSTGLLLGSPAFIAPERAKGGAPQPPSDLFSLGATLYTAVEGHPPFDKPDPVATLTAVVTEDHQPCVRAGDLLCDVVNRLLSKDPAQRPGAAQVRELLEAVVADPDAQLAQPSTGVDADEARTGGHTVALSPADVGTSVRARVLALLVLALVVFVAAAAVGYVVTTR
jgi:eukaryotic-like serine/threonine-protein kinase